MRQVHLDRIKKAAVSIFASVNLLISIQPAFASSATFKPRIYNNVELSPGHSITMPNGVKLTMVDRKINYYDTIFPIISYKRRVLWNPITSKAYFDSVTPDKNTHPKSSEITYFLGDFGVGISYSITSNGSSVVMTQVEEGQAANITYVIGITRQGEIFYHRDFIAPGGGSNFISPIKWQISSLIRNPKWNGSTMPESEMYLNHRYIDTFTLNNKNKVSVKIH